MKKIIISLIIMSISCFCKGQEISYRQQYYYSYDNDIKKLDSICNLIYTIENKFSISQIMMFTEDNINEKPLEELILRKCGRPYRDFRMFMFASEPFMFYNPENSLQPEIFIKILKPGEIFDITIHSRNEDITKIDSIFRCHLLKCTAEQMEQTVPHFLHGVAEYNAEYPYSSLTINWNDLKRVVCFYGE